MINGQMSLKPKFEGGNDMGEKKEKISINVGSVFWNYYRRDDNLSLNDPTEKRRVKKFSFGKKYFNY